MAPESFEIYGSALEHNYFAVYKVESMDVHIKGNQTKLLQ